MKTFVLIALALLLASCGGSSNNNSPPVVVLPPISHPPAVSNGSPWVVTESSAAVPVTYTGGISSFDFLVCSNPLACYISYVEQPYGPLVGKSSLTLSYSITGNAPVFDGHTNTNNNGEPNIPHVLLILHQAGDNMSGVGPYAFYRWFSELDAQALTLGDHELTVPLTVDRWTPVFKSTPEANAAGFATALANISEVGLGYGGGSFAAHGVAVTSGSATFTIKSFGAQ